MADRPRQRWTEQQLAAITAGEPGVLVSAAAGSGKTSVLAQRCVHLVCDARPPCGVNQLLVVTFTEAAAAEMKGRISQALRQRLSAAGDDAHLRRQFALIEHAHVSTLHSFCLALLRQNFQRLGLDPAFRVLDEKEALLMRADLVRKLFEERYEEEAGDFQRFVDGYGDGNDRQLQDEVVSLHGLLGSLIDPQAWMRRALERIAEGAQRPLEQSAIGREFLALLSEKLDALLAECGSSIASLAGMTGLEAYGTYLRGFRSTLEEWKSLLSDRGYDALAAAMKSFEPPRLPSVGSAAPGKETAKSLVDAVREPLKKGFFADTLCFTASQWQAGLAAILPNAKVLVDLVEEFGRRYRAAKDRLHAVDFSDLERFALRLLRDEDRPGLSPSSIARKYHRIFRHVLVDEYQDINEVQDAILGLLAPAGGAVEAPTPAFFCVGDVKQSIYRFRLAEPLRFLQRQQRLRGADAGGRVIDLQANFRSRKPLLDVVNFVFERLMTPAVEIDYDQAHRLHAGADYPASDDPRCFAGAPIELHLLPAKPGAGAGAGDDGEEADPELERNEREAVLIARQIHQMMGHGDAARRLVYDKASSGPMAPRPIDYRDIVILLRSTKFQSEQYVGILQREGIPVHNAAGAGYFDSMEVRDVLSLLRLLDNQQQDIPLAAVLRSPIAALPNADDCLARIRLAYRDAAPAVAFHQAVVRYAAEQKDELTEALKHFLQQLAQWRELSQRQPVADLLWHIYQESGYLTFCAGLDGGQQRCANLISLYDRARQFGGFARQGLWRFVQFLDSLQDQTDLPQAPELSAADDVVRVMSIHAAKGLEFPVVFLPDLGKRINLESCSGDILADRQAFLGLSVVDEARRVRYGSLARVLVHERIRRQSLAEELRVLYVAMTRAREHLILIGTAKSDAPEAWQRRWGGHAGPLPPERLLSAGSMLDWLGPVAAAITPAIQVCPHGADAVAGGEVAPSRRPPFTEHQKKLAELRPLAPAPADDPAAREVTDQLLRRYSFEPFTQLIASQSVTALTKHGQPAPANSDGEPIQQQFATPLPRPKFLATDAALTAPDRGTAVHLALEHLDFTRPATRADLARQIESMLEAQFLTREQAAVVDIDTLVWFLETPLGRQIRATAATLLRELAFNYALPPTRGGAPTSDAPGDQIMLRGRIDLLVPHDGGFVLVDYKTDHVSGTAIGARAEFYRPQMQLYREAVSRLTGRPVHGAQLVFLWPRAIRPV